MNEGNLKEKWEEQETERQKWRERMAATDDAPVPVEMADGSIVDPEVYIVSVPKSGRTWLRSLIGKALIEYYNVNPEDLLELLKLTVSAKIPPAAFIHDGSNLPLKKTWRDFNPDKSAYKNKKVILLIRNPKDVIVSSYVSTTKRKRIYEGSISEFIRSDEYGILKLATFYKHWSDNQSVPRDFWLLRYEDMHENPETCLKAVLKFMGTEDIPEQIVKDAVNFSSFDNMKQMESAGTYNWRLLPSNPSDQDSYKVRKGKIGGYVDYLSSEDIEYIDRVLEEVACPFYNAS